MYINGKYWNNYIGDSDDSLSLIDYLANKQEELITLEEIFADLGLDNLDGNFRQAEEPITTSINIPEDPLVTQFKNDLKDIFISANTITKIKPSISESWIKNIGSH